MTWPTPSPPGVVHAPSITLGAPHHSPKVTKKVTKMTRSHLASLVMGKEGNRHLKSITCLVLRLVPTLSPIWGGKSPIYPPKDPFHSPKATKNATKVARFHFAGLYMDEEWKRHLKSITC